MFKEKIKYFYKKTYRKITSTKASLVLDTALILPVLMIISYFMLSASLTIQHEVMMRYALDQTSKELSLLIPLVDSVYQGMDHSKLDDLLAQIVDSDQELVRAMGDFASSLVLQNFLQKKVDKWLNEGANQLAIKIPDDERQIILTMISDHSLQIKMNYHVYTPWTKTPKTEVTYIPLWTKYDSQYSPSDQIDEDGTEDNIWSEHNFVRGKYFRDKYNANLPFNYPTICRYNNGEILAVRSLDLTAPSYASQDQVSDQVIYEINRLNEFQGSSRNTGLDDLIISSENITTKKLIIVVPGNSDYDLNSALFSNLSAEASKANINLRFEISGNSYRYQTDSENKEN
ncbi:MAG TPA: hypothetical protein VFD28_02410 [Candidatus Eisenbacteria bacterium]|nr:hypothetical protein [Candidatus Eisenbacteria bacterium]